MQKFPVFAFGGAGPVHAFGVARILRSPRVLYPVGAGVLSAIGFLTAPLAFDFVRSLPGDLARLDTGRVSALFAEMEREGRAILGRTVAADAITFRRFVDMRYRKQGYEIRVPVPDEPIDASSIPAMRKSFEDLYRDLYGHIVPDAPIDAVSWRSVAYGPTPELTLPRLSTGPKDAGAALKGRRQVYLADRRGYGEVPVYDRYRLSANTVIEGPAIIEERESTVVINGAATIHVDATGTLIADLPTSR